MKYEAARTATQSSLRAFMRPVSVWVWWKDSASLLMETGRSRTDRKCVQWRRTLLSCIEKCDYCTRLILYRADEAVCTEFRASPIHHNLQTAFKTVRYSEKMRNFHGRNPCICMEQFKIVFQFKTVSSITSSPTNTLNRHIDQLSDPWGIHNSH